MSELASREHLTWLNDELQRRLDIAEAEARAAERAVRIADRLLVERAAKIEEMRDAIQWMSGSADFAPGGKAHEGWIRVRHLALPEADIDAAAPTVGRAPSDAGSALPPRRQHPKGGA